MPAKGTKKVRGHTRKKYLINDRFTGMKIEDPFAKRTRVKSHYRKKQKRKKKSSSGFDLW
jgi:hypothetical protein